MNELVLCILFLGSNATGGLGTTRICENGSFLAAGTTGAGGGGPLELVLIVELALRDVRPYVGQQISNISLVKMLALEAD